jgi:hypothetical protein
LADKRDGPKISKCTYSGGLSKDGALPFIFFDNHYMIFL